MALLVVAGTKGFGQISSAWTPADPGAHIAGDLMLLVVAGHGATAGTDPGTGITGAGSAANGFTYLFGRDEGDPVGSSTDFGPARIQVYGKIATGTSDAWPAHGAGPNPTMYQAFIFRPPGGRAWRDTLTTSAPWIQYAGDADKANPLVGTTGAFSTTPPRAGDAILAVGALTTDSGAAATPTVSCTGLTGGTFANDYAETGVGVDGGWGTSLWEGFTGEATAGVFASWPFNATAGSMNAGVISAIALRTISLPRDVVVVGATSTAVQIKHPDAVWRELRNRAGG